MPGSRLMEALCWSFMMKMECIVLTRIKKFFLLQVDTDWQERYCHILLKLFSWIDQVPVKNSKDKISYNACAKGKSTRAVSPKQP
jgi:hypothetical protein